MAVGTSTKLVMQSSQRGLKQPCQSLYLPTCTRTSHVEEEEPGVSVQPDGITQSDAVVDETCGTAT